MGEVKRSGHCVREGHLLLGMTGSKAGVVVHYGEGPVKERPAIGTGDVFWLLCRSLLACTSFALHND